MEYFLGGGRNQWRPWNVLDNNMPADATIVLTEEVLLTITGNAKTKAVKDNKKYIALCNRTEADEDVAPIDQGKYRGMAWRRGLKG
jgi:hypothetical protein